MLNLMQHLFFYFISSDIHSVSNVLTSEFQSTILLRCQDETEQSLVEYLCHGEGLHLLQMLCILASKVLHVLCKILNEKTERLL